MIGNVLIGERQKAVAGEDGVTVVTVVVNRVAAVHVLPVLAGEEGVLRIDRAAGEAHGKALVEPLHLLQEHHVGVERSKAVAQLVDHHAPVEVRQALVDVERDDPERLLHLAAPRCRSKRRSLCSTKAQSSAVGKIRWSQPHGWIES
jgi:hypothetical protein